MSAIKEYKCPACGGTMEFDSTSQKMKCPYCDTEISVEEYEALNESQTSEDKKSGQTEKNTKESTFVTYICESCGGEITTDKTTGATTCPFCGNRVVLKGQFEGGLKPDYVIPFKLDKKAGKGGLPEASGRKSFCTVCF